MATNPDEAFLYDPTASLPALADVQNIDSGLHPPLQLDLAEHLQDPGPEVAQDQPDGLVHYQHADLESLQAVLMEALQRALGAAAEAGSVLATQEQRIRELAVQLETSTQVADELAMIKQDKKDWEGQARSAQAARDKLEDELLMAHAHSDALRTDHDALAQQVRELESRRREQDLMFCDLQDQLREKDAELEKLKDRIQRLAIVEDAVEEARQHAERQPLAVLVRVNDVETGDYPITKNVFTIGRRSDNDIQVQMAHVSRHHARLSREGDDLYIEDLNSKNGVYVNGLQVTREQLSNGDQLSIGGTEFRYWVTPRD